MTLRVAGSPDRMFRERPDLHVKGTLSELVHQLTIGPLAGGQPLLTLLRLAVPVDEGALCGTIGVHHDRSEIVHKLAFDGGCGYLPIHGSDSMVGWGGCQAESGGTGQEARKSP